MGTREGVAAKIDAETRVKIDEMNRMLQAQQEAVSYYFFMFSFVRIIYFISFVRFLMNKNVKYY